MDIFIERKKPSHVRPSISLILKTPALLKKFRWFCIKEHSVENLDFIIDVRKFKRGGLGLLLYSKIINKYIKNKSVKEINIPESVRICVLNTKFDHQFIYTFDEAHECVMSMLQLDTLIRFHRALQDETIRSVSLSLIDRIRMSISRLSAPHIIP